MFECFQISKIKSTNSQIFDNIDLKNGKWKIVGRVYNLSAVNKLLKDNKYNLQLYTDFVVNDIYEINEFVKNFRGKKNQTKFSFYSDEIFISFYKNNKKVNEARIFFTNKECEVSTFNSSFNVDYYTLAKSLSFFKSLHKINS